MFGLSLERRAAPGVSQWDAALDRLSQARLGGTYAGLVADYDSMLAVPAVWKSLQLTAGIISVMPLDEYTRSDQAATTEVRPSQLLSAPSASVPLEVWIYQHVEAQIMHGDAIGRIVNVDRTGWPTQVELVPNTCVRVERDRATGRLRWSFDNKPIPEDQVWHVPGRPGRAGSPFGVGLIEYMATTAGISLAARKYEAQWFGDGAHPTSILQTPTDPGATGAETLKEKLRSLTRGNREPLVLPVGVTLNSFQENPVNSALLEALRANATDVAHFFGVPPELVGGASGDSMTYSNVEARVLDLLAFAVQFWMVKLEKALTRALPRPRFAKFNEASVIRTDQKTKIETLVAAVAGPVMTPNEARLPLDLLPVEGGDVLNRKQAAAPAEQRINVDARTTVEPSSIEVRTPDIHVDARQAPAQVTVEAPTVNVTTPDVQVDARTTVEPSVVNVAPAEVHMAAPVVNVEAPKSTTRRAVRDERGRITHVVDE